MLNDSLWIKNHPAYDNLAQNRTHGQHYLYETVPNRSERIEMIYRSIGRQYGWDLEQFRMSQKPIDKGNKRRFGKNLLRFFKNPIGTAYWTAESRGFRMRGFLPFSIFFTAFAVWNVGMNHTGKYLE